MMTGTSGRSALALGKSSRPFIPGMLMSERIKMSDTPPHQRCAEGLLGRIGQIPLYGSLEVLLSRRFGLLGG